MKKFIKYIYLSLALVYLPNLCDGQDCNSIDTLNINLFTLEKIPVLSSKKYLYDKIGKPNKILNKKRKSIIFKNEFDKRVVDTVLYYEIVCYNKYSAIYGINNNFARLQSIDFRNSNISIIHRDIILNSQLTFDELAIKYQCSVDSISPHMTPFAYDINSKIPKTWEKTIKTITFSTAERYDFFIVLYFYDNKLIYMSIDY